MNLKLKFLILFTVIITACIGYWQLEASKIMPNTVFKNLKGETFNLADLKDKPVLVTFWAPDCTGCIEEIPDLIELHQQLSNQGLTIIAVAMNYSPPNQVLALTENKQLPYQVALDPDGSIAKNFGNIQLTPTSFLIDRKGKMVMQKVGKFDLAVIKELIKNL